MSMKSCVSSLLVASALIAPQIAQARPHQGAGHGASAREAELEARIVRLESEMAHMRDDLAAARGAQGQTGAAMQAAAAAQASAAEASARADAAIARSTAAATAVAALEKKPVPEGMRSGATTIRLGGFLKMVASESRFSNGPVATNTLGRDFYLPSAIPTTAGGRPTTSTDFTAKQTRLWLNLDTQVAGHVVKGYVETDFQTTANAAQNVTGGGSQRTTNGYTLALRRAFVTVDRFTFGQDWTNFQYVPALPESTDFIGATEGTVFVRQPQVRYAAPLGKAVTLSIAAENPESALATAGAAALAENGTDHLPDFTARLALSGKHGEVSLAGIVRQIRGEANGTVLVNSGSGVTTTGYGGSIAGKLWLNGAKTADLRFMATYGSGIGRYVGLNFAPDAVYLPGGTRLNDVKVFAAFAALRLPLLPGLRANVIGSYQRVDYGGLTLAQVGVDNHRAWSGAVNLFYSPARPIDLGIEYRHGDRQLVNGAEGKLDRVEFAAKYNF